MKQKKEQRHPVICTECGKPVCGEPEYVRTRRGSILFFHKACVRRGRDETGQ